MDSEVNHYLVCIINYNTCADNDSWMMKGLSLWKFRSKQEIE